MPDSQSDPVKESRSASKLPGVRLGDRSDADDATLADVLLDLERLGTSNALDDWLDKGSGSGQATQALSGRLDELSVGDLERLMHARGCIAMLGELHQHETVGDAVVDDTTELPGECPKTIGRYKIQGLLGKGGFANVYLALDETLNRRVALKVPHGSVLANPDAAARFQREAKAIAILDHPNIVPVYEAGQVEERSYLSLAYVPGEDLQSYLRSIGEPMTPRNAALAMRSIAAAIGYAHSKGFVHRDIKPGNVLIAYEAPGDADDRLSERPWHDRLRVTDFGLAKTIAGDLDVHQQSNTMEGLAIGTPAYMSPEQCRGEKSIGPPSDVFSLGSLFFELLTGAPPHRRDTYAQTFHSIESEETPRLRREHGDVPKDLQAIVSKCLEKSPLRRYATAFELCEDLDRWLDDRPVEARTVGPGERAWRWVRRNPLVAAAVSVGVLGLSVGAVVATLKYREATAARRLAETAAQQAAVAAATSDEGFQTLL